MRDKQYLVRDGLGPSPSASSTYQMGAPERRLDRDETVIFPLLLEDDGPR